MDYVLKEEVQVAEQFRKQWLGSILVSNKVLWRSFILPACLWDGDGGTPRHIQCYVMKQHRFRYDKLSQKWQFLHTGSGSSLSDVCCMLHLSALGFFRFYYI